MGFYSMVLLVNGVPYGGSTTPPSGDGVFDGQLTEDDEIARDRYVDYYEYELEAGDNFFVELLDADFDTMVFFGGEGEEFDNDDGGEGTLSLLDVTVGYTGTYRLGITSFAQYATGYYVAQVLVNGEAYNGGGTTTPPVTGNGTVEGELTESDPQVEGEGPFYDEYTLELNAGSWVTISLTSEDIDTYLTVVGPEGVQFNNDDGGEGVNSYLEFEVPYTGNYAVWASSFGTGETGAYTLTVTVDGQPYPFGGGGTTTPPQGGPIFGELTETDTVYEMRGSFADFYEFDANEGDELDIQLMGDFDTYLYLEWPNGEYSSNDDGGEGTNSWIQTVAPMTGTYRVVATSFGAGVTGSYELHILVNGDYYGAGGSTTPEQGGVFEGELTEDDPINEWRGTFSDVYEVALEAGHDIVIDLESDDFDTYLYVYSPSGNEYANDDGGVGTNSQVAFTSDESGVYRIEATSYGQGAVGAYRVSVYVDGELLGTGGGTTDPQPEESGFDGELAPSDEVYDARGTIADYFDLTFEDGQEIVVELTSDVFDTYLYVELPSGDVLNNDDGGEGTNSRLAFISQAGDHRIVVTGYGDGDIGPYSLAVSVDGEMLGGGGTDTTPEGPVGTIEGELSETDPTTEYRGTPADTYAVNVAADQEVYVDLVADFDTYLFVEFPNGEVLADDDGGEGVNSRLVFLAPETGTYNVIATCYGGGLGPYTLTVMVDGEPYVFGSTAPPATGITSLPLNSRTPIQVAADGFNQYEVELEGDVVDLRIAVAGADADFDLYMRVGEAMDSPADADDASVTFNFDEELSYRSMQAGTLYIGVRNDSGAVGSATLVIEGTLVGGGTADQPTAIDLAIPTEVTVESDSFRQFVATIPADAGAVTITVDGSTSDFDVYSASSPMSSPDDAQDAAVTFNWDETLVLDGVGAGPLYVLVYNDGASTGTTTLTIDVENMSDNAGIRGGAAGHCDHDQRSRR